MHIYMNILLSLFSILFPEKCLGCGAAGGLVCSECLRGMPRAVEVYPDTISVFEYRHKVMKDLMWKMKYSHARSVAALLAPHLYETLVSELSERSLEGFVEPIFVGIPISKTRKRGRGYNQSEVLAHTLANFDKANAFPFVKDALVKTRDTTPQARIKNRSFRLSNLKNAFVVNQKYKHKVRGRNIVIVDDISTTGATIEEARRALRKAGARHILGFTIAH